MKTKTKEMTGKPSVRLNYHLACHLIQSRSKLPEHEDTFFLVLFLFLIGGQLLYSVWLVSAGQQWKSAISIHLCILPCLSLSLDPPNTPIPQFRLSPEYQIELPVLHTHLPLATYFTDGQLTHEKMFNIILNIIRKRQIKTTRRYDLSPVRKVMLDQHLSAS